MQSVNIKATYVTLIFSLSVLQESPVTDKGSVVDIFTDLTVWMGIRKIIEQVNANAVALRKIRFIFTRFCGSFP